MLNWTELAARFPKGATARAKAEAERQKQETEAAEAAKPKPPDPRDVLIASWAQRDGQTFDSLISVIDGFIQSHSAERREAVGSHAHMAFHEGETAALEQLRSKLTTLRG